MKTEKISTNKKKFSMPHTYALLFGVIVICTILPGFSLRASLSALLLTLDVLLLCQVHLLSSNPLRWGPSP